MKIYKVSYSGDPDGHKGYSYFSNRKAAEAEVSDWNDGAPHHNAAVEVLIVAPTKAGIISALNIHGGHCDND